MAPPRKRTTKLGTHLRLAREAMSLTQTQFGSLVFASVRTLSRWENGEAPPPERRARILEACERLPPDAYNEMARVLGIPLPEPSPESSSVAPRGPDPRAILDGLVLAAAEDHDVLPRHLRAFGVELLRGVERLGLGAGEAAALLALGLRKGKKIDADEVGGGGT